MMKHVMKRKKSEQLRKQSKMNLALIPSEKNKTPWLKREKLQNEEK
jgi:hypothetical protein